MTNSTTSSPVLDLPPPAALERICKGLAALDAILCDDWESRYYSFNAAWSADRNERMASMRNGSGDDWFIVFGPAGAFMKSFWHEYPHEDVAQIYAGIPAALEPQLREPAFQMDAVTFGGFHAGATTTWILRGNAAPLAEDLAILAGDPAAYCTYATEYFELTVPPDAVAHVLAGHALDDALITRLSGTRTLAELEDDLAEIGYAE